MLEGPANNAANADATAKTCFMQKGMEGWGVSTNALFDRTKVPSQTTVVPFSRQVEYFSTARQPRYALCVGLHSDPPEGGVGPDRGGGGALCSGNVWASGCRYVPAYASMTTCEQPQEVRPMKDEPPVRAYSTTKRTPPPVP